MLQTCSREEFDQYADFAYELALDLTKSAYPTYCDGIKTKEMFVERNLKAFERETEEMLLFVYEGKVEGMIHLYWMPDDHYLSTNIFSINKAAEQALSEFLSYAEEHFKGYDLYLGLPAENSSAVDFLSKHGFECIEDDYNNTAFLNRIDPVSDHNGIIRIGKENYQLFEALHDQIDGDMYWNSERIFEDLDHWIVHVKEKDGKPLGAVYYTDAQDGWYEIFGIDIDRNEYDRNLFSQLLNAAMADAKQRGGRVMTFFCEKEYEKTAVECGFQSVGNYLCFKTNLG